MYSANSIKVLKGLDAVRKRPGMYIGNVDDGSGLHHMIFEALDNAVDEALVGYCNTISVILNKNGSVSVMDNGRGIPVDFHQDEGISAAEVIMTKLHSGSKFDNDAYKISGGLHGLGISVVNALSDWLELIIWRNNCEYTIKFKFGILVQSLQVTKKHVCFTGTKVTFLPSASIFGNINFNFHLIETRLKELSYLNSGIKMHICDNRFRVEKKVVFFSIEGIKSYVRTINSNKSVLNLNIISFKIVNSSAVSFECAMQWNNSYNESILCFTNNIKQKDGGSHLSGLKSALTRAINTYIGNNNFFKKREQLNIVGNDVREGLICILSVKVQSPNFSSQTKDKLISSEVRYYIESVLYTKLLNWFNQYSKDIKPVILKIINAAVVRDSLKKAREVARKATLMEISTLPGKLSDCQENDPKNSELFIVEGDSAGGTAKQGRNRNIQAILPLRGKLLNIERSNVDKIFHSEQISALIAAIGTNVEGMNFDISKLRYNKIIIMTDADVDGAHIRTLLLTFFYRYMKPLILQGHLYIASPPLLKVSNKSSEVYIKDDNTLNVYLVKLFLKKFADQVFILNKAKSGVFLQEILLKILNFICVLNNININFNKLILEYLAISDIFNVNFLDNFIMERLNINNLNFCLKLINKEESVFSWSYDLCGNDLIFYRKIYGIKEKHIFNIDFFKCNEIKTLFFLGVKLYTFLNKGVLLQGICQSIIFRPTILIQSIFNFIQKKLFVQRFKGLGEMNADQLWGTTMNPDSRTLLQVEIKDEQYTESIFSRLMGHAVSPRKKFIYDKFNIKNII